MIVKNLNCINIGNNIKNNKRGIILKNHKRKTIANNQSSSSSSSSSSAPPEPDNSNIACLNLAAGLYKKKYEGYFYDINEFFDSTLVSAISIGDIGKSYQILDIGTSTQQDWYSWGFVESPQYSTQEALGLPFPSIGKGVSYFGGGPIENAGTANLGPVLVSESITSQIDDNYSQAQGQNNKSLIIKGYFKPTVNGIYKFRLISDDASYLWFGNNSFDSNRNINNAVVAVPGIHGPYPVEGSFTMTKDSYYPLTVEFGNGPDGEGVLIFEYMPPGSDTWTSDLAGKLFYDVDSKGHRVCSPPPNIDNMFFPSLWLKADTGVTLDGSNVTAWADQSNNGRNFSKYIEDTGFPTFSDGAVLFTSSHIYGDPNASVLALPSQSLNLTGPYTLITLVRAGANNSCVFSKSNNNNKRRKYQLAVNGGTIYAMEGTNNEDNYISYDTGTGDDITVKRLIVSQFTSNTSGLIRYNGAEVAVGDGNGPNGEYGYGIDETNSASVCIGAAAFQEGNGYNGEASTEMYVYEIIFYNRALNTLEIQQVENYLVNKYGMQLPNINNMFLPSLWLKADAGVILNNSNVSVWQDQSNNGNNAVAKAGGVTIVNNSLNGKPVLRFNGSSNLITNSFYPTNYNTPITIIAVSRASASTVRGEQPTARYVQIVNDQSDWDFGLTYGGYETENPNFSVCYGKSYDGSDDIESSPMGENAIGLAIAINDGSTISSYLNGTLIGTANSSVWNNGGDAVGSFSIGSEVVRNINAETFFATCDIAEIIIYNRALTTLQRQEVENYLSNKYAISL